MIPLEYLTLYAMFYHLFRQLILPWLFENYYSLIRYDICTQSANIISYYTTCTIYFPGCLIGYYFLAETWFAVLFTVIVEIVPPEVRLFSASYISFVQYCRRNFVPIGWLDWRPIPNSLSPSRLPNSLKYNSSSN